MRKECWIDHLKNPPHYYEIHSLQGVTGQMWTWGPTEKIAEGLAKIYQEPNLRRILGGEITAVIFSQTPESFLLNGDGTATRLAGTNKRLRT